MTQEHLLLPQLTTGEGMHSVTMDHGNRRFVDVVSTLSAPPHMLVFALEYNSEQASFSATLLHEVPHTVDPRVAALGAHLAPPEIVSIPTKDGSAELFCAAFKPNPAEHGPGPYPTVSSQRNGRFFFASFFRTHL
jgi:hypothetical protein